MVRVLAVAVLVVANVVLVGLMLWLVHRRQFGRGWRSFALWMTFSVLASLLFNGFRSPDTSWWGVIIVGLVMGLVFYFAWSFPRKEEGQPFERPDATDKDRGAVRGSGTVDTEALMGRVEDEPTSVRLRSRRWRYVIIASMGATTIPMLVVGLVAGAQPRQIMILTLLLLGASLAGDLAVWWLAGDRLRARGWEW